MNMFLEKIYIFLWLWFLMVGLLSLTSLLTWIARVGSTRCRISWIHSQLLTLRIQHPSVVLSKQFVEQYLGPDGVFLLQLICTNYGDLIVGDIVGELWFLYKQRRIVNQPKPKAPLFKGVGRKAFEKSSAVKTSPPKYYNAKIDELMLNSRRIGFEGVEGSHLGTRDSRGRPTIVESSLRSRIPSVMHGHVKQREGTFDNKRSIGVVGIDVASNRDQLRHPAEWLTMVGRGSTSSSKSGSDALNRMGMDFRSDSRGSGSPPPVPNRNPSVSGNNSDQKSFDDVRDMHDSDRTALSDQYHHSETNTDHDNDFEEQDISHDMSEKDVMDDESLRDDQNDPDLEDINDEEDYEADYDDQNRSYEDHIV